MKKILITLVGLYCANFSNAQNVTTAGNGLYKPTTSSLALSDGSVTTTSAVVLDFGTSSLGSFLIKKGANNYLSISNNGGLIVGNNTQYAGATVYGGVVSYGRSYFSEIGGDPLFLGNAQLFSASERGVYDSDTETPLVVFDPDVNKSRYGINGVLAVGLSGGSPKVFIGTDLSTANSIDMEINGKIFCNKKIFIGTADANTATKIAPYALAVNGDAIFNKVKVKLYSTWPDYVFNIDYQLPTLDEIELFIKKNKHLPGVPSENEAKENGIDVGEMQSVLLEKVEQLTLYMIELNKKINQLEKENQSLKVELKKSTRFD